MLAMSGLRWTKAYLWAVRPIVTLHYRSLAIDYDLASIRPPTLARAGAAFAKRQLRAVITWELNER
jgi:hypothetical protein